MSRRRAVEPADLDLGHLAQFVGYAFADAVQRALEAEGFVGLRFSHGFVFQHLIETERSIGELARRMQVTQQAASKAVVELEQLGYVERSVDELDARTRRVGLSARGRAAVEAARRARGQVERKLASKLGARALSVCRADLARMLDELGGAEAVRRRRIVPPR
ncbi:MAG TPA: helix-turn-helix domain-containing protein [Polyangiaceae bacterium]|nr:helix-turn-helix domain-containing protein [Polyangiaceae bacterium]